jgi:hypothetical protein
VRYWVSLSILSFHSCNYDIFMGLCPYGLSAKCSHNFTVCLKCIYVCASSSSPITMLRSVLPHLTVTYISKPKHPRIYVIYFRLICLTRHHTMESSCGIFLFTVYNLWTCKSVDNPLTYTFANPYYLIQVVKNKRQEHLRTSTSPKHSKARHQKPKGASERLYPPII